MKLNKSDRSQSEGSNKKLRKKSVLKIKTPSGNFIASDLLTAKSEKSDTELKEKNQIIKELEQRFDQLTVENHDLKAKLESYEATHVDLKVYKLDDEMTLLNDLSN